RQGGRPAHGLPADAQLGDPAPRLALLCGGAAAVPLPALLPQADAGHVLRAPGIPLPRAADGLDPEPPHETARALAPAAPAPRPGRAGPAHAPLRPRLQACPPVGRLP